MGIDFGFTRTEALVLVSAFLKFFLNQTPQIDCILGFIVLY